MKQEKPEKISKIRLKEDRDLVISLVDDERLHIQVYLDSDRYKGPTKRRARFYLFDRIWEKFFELMQKVN